MVISPVHFPIYSIQPRRSRGDSFFDSVFYFRRGSWALAYGIMAIAKRRGKDRVRVWFPDYFCREPLEILQRFPIEVGYYPVQKNLTPTFEALEHMVNDSVPDALVLVHYFIFPNDLSGAKAFCAKHGIDLIEDCAHVMRPQGPVGTSGTISIWSPWKFFPVPKLGVLWARDEVKPFVDMLTPSREVLSLMQWWAKREAQRMLCGVGVNWYNPYHLPLTLRGSERGLPASPNALSLRLFRTYLRNTDHLRTRRVDNYKALENFFKQKYPEMVLFSELPAGAVPYAFPCVTKRPALEVSRELIRRGIPAFPWPALPEEVVRDRRRYQWAHWYAEHLLLFPVHQNVSSRQIEYMKQQIAIIWS